MCFKMRVTTPLHVSCMLTGLDVKPPTTIAAYV